MEKRSKIIIIILSVIIVILTSYIIYDKLTNQELNDNNENNQSSQEIVIKTVDGDSYKKELYINNNKVDFLGLDFHESYEVNKIDNIYIVKTTINTNDLYAIDKDGKIIGRFAPESVGETVIRTKEMYRDTYRIEGNSVYIETDNLSQDPQYAVCNMKKDTDVVVYEEKFTYIGNNQFESEVTKEITAQEYIKTNNIKCN